MNSLFCLRHNMAICYYSNFCEPSKSLLQKMAKTKLSQEIHFICIDNRRKDAKGQTVITMNQQQLLLPPSITKVPALFVIGTQQALFEDEIYKYLAPREEKITHQATRGEMEPESYGGARMSDAFSFWDQNSNELTTEGTGGTRQMHNFVPIDHADSIPTPKDDYEPDKVGANGTKTLDQYKAEREMAVAQPKPPI